MAVTFFVIIVFIIQTGNKNKTWKPELPERKLLWVSAVIGGGIGILCLFTLMPYLRKRVLAWEAEQNRQANVPGTSRQVSLLTASTSQSAVSAAGMTDCGIDTLSLVMQGSFPMSLSYLGGLTSCSSLPLSPRIQGTPIRPVRKKHWLGCVAWAHHNQI